MIAMRKKTLAYATEDDLLIDLTLNNVPASSVIDFTENIVRPYYKQSPHKTRVRCLAHHSHQN